jgi:REP element-mobilizing transposase RayT
MSVRKQIQESNGIYFITFTCARWLHLFDICQSYGVVYNWFDYLKSQGHYIVGYVIMPNHVHVIIGFANTGISINKAVGNGKRFLFLRRVSPFSPQSLASDSAAMLIESHKSNW